MTSLSSPNPSRIRVRTELHLYSQWHISQLLAPTGQGGHYSVTTIFPGDKSARFHLWFTCQPSQGDSLSWSLSVDSSAWVTPGNDLHWPDFNLGKCDGPVGHDRWPSSSCDVVITDDTVSGRHCRISATSSGHVIEDLGSSNGTFVNGRRVETSTLQSGDRLTLEQQPSFLPTADSCRKHRQAKQRTLTPSPPPRQRNETACLPARRSLSS